MNPYAFLLGGHNPCDVIAETPQRLAAVARTLGSDRINNRLASGKWSAREILCHLADTEIAFAFRLRQALAEPHHVIQPFDQDKWASYYAGIDPTAALETLSTLRGWNRKLIAGLPPEAFSKPVSHPERGEMTFQTLVETMAGHDLNHLRQLDAIVTHTASA